MLRRPNTEEESENVQRVSAASEAFCKTKSEKYKVAQHKSLPDWPAVGVVSAVSVIGFCRADIYHRMVEQGSNCVDGIDVGVSHR